MRNGRLVVLAALAASFVPALAAAAPVKGSIQVTGYVPVTCRSAPASPSFVTCNNPGAFVLRTVMAPASAAEDHAAPQSAVAAGKRVIITPQI